MKILLFALLFSGCVSAKIGMREGLFLDKNENVVCVLQTAELTTYKKGRNYYLFKDGKLVNKIKVSK